MIVACLSGSGRLRNVIGRRLRRLASVMPLVAACALPGSVRAEDIGLRVSPANIFVEDDRQLIRRDSTASSGAVVLIVDPTTNKAGTGFLISPCLVMSAIHIVLSDFDLSTRTAPRAQYEYVVYHGSGAIAGGFADFSIARPIAWGRYFASDPVDASQDWIVLQLDACPAASRPYFQVSELPLSETVGTASFRLAGHPRRTDDSANSYEFVQVDPSCSVHQEVWWPMNQGPLWLHDCATRPGASGAPIYIEQETAQAVAIAIGELQATPGVIRQFDQAHANVAVPLRNAAVALAALAAETRDRIAEAQSLLHALGHSHVAADGVADPQTRLAVYQYRVHRGLPASALITDDLLTTLRIEAARRAGADGRPLEPAAQP